MRHLFGLDNHFDIPHHTLSPDFAFSSVAVVVDPTGIFTIVAFTLLLSIPVLISGGAK